MQKVARTLEMLVVYFVPLEAAVHILNIKFSIILSIETKSEF